MCYHELRGATYGPALFASECAGENRLITAIRFSHVSKRFTLQHQRPRSFQELAIQFFNRNGEAPARQLEAAAGVAGGGREDFWALRGVSFTIEQGETVGIIGPNGAGKSTVLKLISRIIEPTSGEIEVNGRVGALLELGAGFHPDLSGRENIYLNGSILGLNRFRIDEKLDKIIAFAELDRFIDMPVRHYSSGMRMRLGFSVAAHIDPEILLIDEVLAVGDENFQHKCLDRIMEMRRQGVTICFVSHGLGSVRRLCSRAIWLNDGSIQAQGAVEDVISAYLRHAADEEESRIRGSVAPIGRIARDRERQVDRTEEINEDWDLKIAEVAVVDSAGRARHVFQVGQPWTAWLRYHAREGIVSPLFRLTIHRNDGLCVSGSSVSLADLNSSSVQAEGNILYRVSQLPLMEGTYFLSASAHNQAGTLTFDHHDRIYTFKVRQVGRGERYGLVSLGGRWQWRSEGQAAEQATSSPRTARESRGLGQVGSDAEQRWGVGGVDFVDVSFLDATGVERRVFETGEPWTVRLCYRASWRIEEPVFGLAVHRSDGVHICGPNTHFGGLDIPFIEGAGQVLYRVDHLPLMDGTYCLSVSAHNRADTVMYDYHDRLHAFKVCRFGPAEASGVVKLSGEWKWEARGAE
jgi:lipopolysaccharide transport system ATP-binding protein